MFEVRLRLVLGARVVLRQLGSCFTINHFLHPGHVAPTCHRGVLMRAPVMLTTSRSLTLIIQYQNFNETSLKVLMQ